jgi:hypothetical protein
MTLTIEERRAQRVAYMRRYREKNREKLRPIRQAEGRRYWQENKDKIIAKRKEKPPAKVDRDRARAYAKAWRERNPEKAKEVYREFNKRNPSRNGKYRLRRQETVAGRPKPKACEICGDDRRRLAFDHCHKSGSFRGWICTGCNTVLGLVNDDTDRLRKLIIYLTTTPL